LTVGGNLSKSAAGFVASSGQDPFTPSSPSSSHCLDLARSLLDSYITGHKGIFSDIDNCYSQVYIISLMGIYMKKVKKISTNIPEDLLRKACDLTNLNQTEALIAGLKELIAQHEREAILDLKGKVRIDLNLDEIRQRVRL